LGGAAFVFWNGRDGYSSLLNTDVALALEHQALFYRYVVEHKTKVMNWGGTLLIEPKPKEPAKHQYEFDAQTTIGFLKTHNLDKHFKLNIEPNHTTLAGHSYEHDVVVASKLGMLGSIDANTGDPSLGWDTDQFPFDVKHAVLLMRAVITQNGLIGGLNFDCKLRRESTNVADLFIAFIGAIDTFAKALRVAAAMTTDPLFSTGVAARYAEWTTTPLGTKLSKGALTMEEVEQFVKTGGEPKLTSGEQEKWEITLNTLINKH